MNSANDFKKASEVALQKRSRDEQDHPINIPGNDNFTIDEFKNSKIVKKVHKEVFNLYQDIKKKKEIWLNDYGICLKEVIYGERIGHPHEEIKSNYYTDFDLIWENGDCAIVRSGKIIKIRTGGESFWF